MNQKYPLRYLNRQLDESEESYAKRRESIFESTTDTIDYYDYGYAYNRGKLSEEQIQELKEAAAVMQAFGERGEKWYELANEIIQQNKSTTK